MTQENFDIAWMLIAGLLVFAMQPGFMCLECGLTRSKNSINVAIKNLTDFQICFLVFWLIGFGLMFGKTADGWIGTTGFLLPLERTPAWNIAFFFFQAMFAATASTILSGAIAERARFGAYMLIAVMVSVFVYPVFGHWAWNGADGLSEGGWLADRGFIDFAGSTVVHSVGGWVSLAALLVIGPRAGRFVDGKPQKITGHSLQLSVLGTLLLFFGWFGFNGGSTLTMDASVPGIIANTALAAAAGALATLSLGWTLRGRPDVELVINGCLAGLVAVTANCHAVSAASAVLIGAVGGICMYGCERLLERLHVDDAVGAVPVHLAAGIWGTLAVALFGDMDTLGVELTRWEHLVVQLQGVAVCGLWAFGLMYLLLRGVDRFFPLRIDAEAEHSGLNIAEHGASTELIDLLTAMTRQGRAGDLGMRVPVEPFTEVGQIASRYNAVMDLLQRAVHRAETIVRDMQDGIVTFNRYGKVVSFNPGAEKLFGISTQDAVGGPIQRLLTESVHIDLESLVADRERHVVEIEAKHALHGPFVAEARISRSRVDGDLLYTALIKDITELKRAQQALRASRDSIQRQNQALAQLAATGAERGGDFAHMLSEITRVAAETLEASAATLWRYDRDAKRLALAAQFDRRGAAVDPGAAMDIGGSLPLQAVLDNMRIITMDDVWDDPRTQEIWGQYLSPRGTLSLLAATVRVGGGVWGVLFAEQAGRKRAWGPEEQQFLGSMADYVALACEDAERRRAEQRVIEMNQELEERVVLRTHELHASNQELRATLETLQQAQRQLVQNEKMAALGELVAGVAHEINTPVGVALTAASHLEAQTRQVVRDFQGGALKKSALDRYIQHADESANMLLSNLMRASELVQSFKRVAVDQSSEARRGFHVRQYLNEILLSLRPKLKRTNHAVIVEGPEDVEVNSYPGAFSQVVTNLIVNSLTHAYDDRDDGRIRISFEADAVCVTLRYEDDGKGIDPAHLPRIFDPFFTTKRGSGGSGLGLHLVYNLVTATLRGAIECESEVGRGTRFTVRIPLDVEQGGVLA